MSTGAVITRVHTFAHTGSLLAASVGSTLLRYAIEYLFFQSDPRAGRRIQCWGSISTACRGRFPFVGACAQ